MSINIGNFAANLIAEEINPKKQKSSNNIKENDKYGDRDITKISVPDNYIKAIIEGTTPILETKAPESEKRVGQLIEESDIEDLFSEVDRLQEEIHELKAIVMELTNAGTCAGNIGVNTGNTKTPEPKDIRNAGRVRLHGKPGKIIRKS